MEKLDKKEHYVYVYCDPRKVGNFKYGNYIFENEPFYVGKGKKNRAFQHLKCKEHNKKHYKIQKILRLGYNLQPIFLMSELSDEEACLKEIELIKLIGREDFGNGPLLNLTNGGDGLSGFKRTEKQRKALIERNINSHPFKNKSKDEMREISEKRKNTINLKTESERKNTIKKFVETMKLKTEEEKSLIRDKKQKTKIENFDKLTSEEKEIKKQHKKEISSKSMKGKKHSEGTKLKIGKKIKEWYENNDHPCKNVPKTDEHKEKISKSKTGQKYNEEFKRKRSEYMKTDKNPMLGKGLFSTDNGMFGKKHSKKSIEKMKQTKLEKGNEKGENNPRAKPVKCLETGEVYGAKFLASIEKYGDKKFVFLINESIKNKKQIKCFTWLEISKEEYLNTKTIL